MQKLYSLLIMFMVMSSCTKNASINSTNQTNPETSLITEVADLSATIAISPEDIDSQIGSKTIVFKPIYLGQIIKKRIYLQNNLENSTALNVSSLTNSLNNTPFTIIKNTCSQNLSKENNCFLDLSLSYSESLSYNPITVQLYSNSSNLDFGKITLIATKGITPVQNKDIQFVKIGQLSSMNSDKSIRIYLKNIGDKIEDAQITIPSEYVISKTDCKASLPKDKVCFIDLKLNPNLDPNIVGINKDIAFDGITFSIKAGGNASPGSIACRQGYHNILNVCIQDNDNCQDGSVKLGESCVSISSYYNTSCNCYKNVPYIPDQIAFNIDGLQDTGIGYETMDLYLPTVSSNLIGSGKLIFYSHAMSETKELDSWYESSLKDESLAKGYTFASVEFRHPILESEEVDINNNQNDLIHALRTIRNSYHFLKMTNPNNIYSFSYSKGSLLLANLLSNNSLLNDDLGRVSVKKMYILDGQITYNFDTYYNIYMNKDPVKLYFGSLHIGDMGAYEAFGMVNSSARDMTGMELTKDLAVIDSYRFLTTPSIMEANPAASLPDIYFAYNSKDKNKLLSSQDLSSTKFINITIIPEEVDYLLHNPQAISNFCPTYISYGKSCIGQDDRGYVLSISEILDFFEY